MFPRPHIVHGLRFKVTRQLSLACSDRLFSPAMSVPDPIQTFTGSKLDVDFFVIQLGLLMFSGANAGGPDNN